MLAVAAVRIGKHGDRSAAVALDLLQRQIERQIGECNLAQFVDAFLGKVFMGLGIQNISDEQIIYPGVGIKNVAAAANFIQTKVRRLDD